MQSRTIRRRSSVLEARFTNWTVRENSYHRSKTRHVNRKCECEHNIRETGRGGILRQSQRLDRFYAAAVPAVVPVVGGGGSLRMRARIHTVRRSQDSRFRKNITRCSFNFFLLLSRQLSSNYKFSFQLPQFTKMRNQTLNFLLNDGPL